MRRELRKFHILKIVKHTKKKEESSAHVAVTYQVLMKMTGLI